MEKLELKIEGMHCGACATGIQMLVSQLEGVYSVFVDYSKKTAVIQFDAAKVNKEKIIKEIENLGYHAS